MRGHLPLRTLRAQVSLSAFSLAFLPRLRRKQPDVRRAVPQRVRQRPISIVSRIEGSKKCSICLGVIKRELTSIGCSCGSSFHNSCALRVGICPICRSEIVGQIQTSKDEPAMEPIKSMPLSRDDRLFLLEDRLLSGEIDQGAYQKLKQEISSTMPEPVYCANCGGKLYPGEKCDCVDRTPQRCPECGREIAEGDEFCRSCGVVFSDDFKQELFQCAACGRIVSASERICSCGAALLDPGDSVCPDCGHPVPAFSNTCPNCGCIRVIELLECPSCGREVSPNDFECECGAIFEDRIERIECPECSAEVGRDDRFCRSCGVQFIKGGFSSFHKSP
jgi:hypothetical protein